MSQMIKNGRKDIGGYNNHSKNMGHKEKSSILNELSTRNELISCSYLTTYEMYSSKYWEQSWILKKVKVYNPVIWLMGAVAVIGVINARSLKHFSAPRE